MVIARYPSGILDPTPINYTLLSSYNFKYIKTTLIVLKSRTID